MTSRDDSFTPEEYLKYLEVDDTNRHILVEGRDDERVFELLLHEIQYEDDSVLVDSAEVLINCDPQNRRVVEDICERIADEPYAVRLAGFVDRELREFARFPELCDHINCHRVYDRLVWSRGHSVENYLFDFCTLCDSFIAFSPNGFSKALSSFETIFESVVRLACAIGLAATEVDKLRRVRRSVDACMLKVDGSNVRIDFDGWRKNLADKLTDKEVEELFAQFDLYYDRAQRSDYNVVRWMCDGHLGFRLIWTAYDLCVQLSGQKGTLKSKHPLCFNVCVNSWIKSALLARYGDECPVAVLDLLGINVLET